MNYWKDKKVLVTGADGFMGSHLTEKLLELGAKVTAFVRSTSVSGTFKVELRNIPHLKDKVNFIASDISSEDSINLIKENNPEIIFHLAAIAYVPYSFEHPLEVTKVNVGGTLNVLEAVRKMGDIKKVVYTSSSEIYGTAQKDKINEDHPLNPSSPYGASKLAADRFAYSYYFTYGLPIAIICPFNTYGPRHAYDVVPKFIEAALKNKPITIYGEGKQSRDLTYYKDMIGAFLIMGGPKGVIGKRINFGSEKDYSINHIAERIKEISNSKSEIIHIKERPAEVNKLCCDASKAKSLFNWRTKVSLEEGLKDNIEWARKCIK